MNWISVKDKLPINEEDIISTYVELDVIVYDGSNVYCCIFSAGRETQYWYDFDVDNVTHWMPLPEPPEES